MKKSTIRAGADTALGTVEDTIQFSPTIFPTNHNTEICFLIHFRKHIHRA